MDRDRLNFFTYFYYLESVDINDIVVTMLENEILTDKIVTYHGQIFINCLCKAILSAKYHTPYSFCILT